MKTLEDVKQYFFNIIEDPDYIVLEPKKNIKNLLILDPGLFHIATCRSGISKIDGENGRLYYRGISIEKLVDNQDFIDVAFYIIGENISDAQSKDKFNANVRKYFCLSPELKAVLDSIPAGIHPMSFAAIGITTLSSVESKYLENQDDLKEKAKFIIAQMAVIAAYYYLKLHNKEWIKEDADQSIAYNFLNQLFHDQIKYDLPVMSKIFNKVLILHAEHDQNCSTATVRAIASAGGDIYSAVAAGIAAFKGNLHGGASQNVAEMYEEFLLHNLDVNDYVNEKLKNKQRLMGFGHRIYSCWDPRAKIMLNMLNANEFKDPMVDAYKSIALKLIARVGSDEFFIKRGIYPNPDLLNCIFYKLLGVPSSMNTVMLAVSRVAGWVAHYIEHVNDKLPIMRPCQLQK